MILLALALAIILHLDPTDDATNDRMVESVQCSQWERIDENHWRAEAGADVLFEDGKWHHFDGAVDATEEYAPDLTDSVEAFCHVLLSDGDTH